MSANPTLLVPLGRSPWRASLKPSSLSLSQIWYERSVGDRPFWQVRKMSARQSPSKSIKAFEWGVGNLQSKLGRSWSGGRVLPARQMRGDGQCEERTHTLKTAVFSDSSQTLFHSTGAELESVEKPSRSVRISPVASKGNGCPRPDEGSTYGAAANTVSPNPLIQTTRYSQRLPSLCCRYTCISSVSSEPHQPPGFLLPINSTSSLPS